MAAGMTIACSNKSSIPELIEDAGEFFEPTNHLSIYNTLQNLIKDQKLRLHLSNRARKLAMKYSWQKCSDETFSYISECYGEIV